MNIGAAPIQALETFAARMPRGATILCTDPEVAIWLSERGLQVQALDPAKDLRMLSLKRETYDGIWSSEAFSSFPIEDAQRVIASFFQALRPKTGVFYASHPYAELAFASMVRQNGFELDVQWQGQWQAQDRTAFIAHRI